MNLIISNFLCVGANMRLWPSARPRLPKQLMSPVGWKGLLQQAVLRLRSSALGDLQVRPTLAVVGDESWFLDAYRLREVVGLSIHAFAIQARPEGS